MPTDLAQEAILAALSGDWGKALKINQEILKTSPNDIDALNRLRYLNLMLLIPLQLKL